MNTSHLLLNAAIIKRDAGKAPTLVIPKESFWRKIFKSKEDKEFDKVWLEYHRLPRRAYYQAYHSIEVAEEYDVKILLFIQRRN